MKMLKSNKMVTVATSLLTLASVGLTPVANASSVVLADTTASKDSTSNTADTNKVSGTDMSQANVKRMVDIAKTKAFSDKADKYGTAQQKSAFKQALAAADKAVNAEKPSDSELRSTGMALYRSMVNIDNAAKLNLVKLNDKANKAVSNMSDDVEHTNLDKAIANANLILSNLSASMDDIAGGEKALTNAMVDAGLMKADNSNNSSSSNSNSGSSSSDNGNSSSTDDNGDSNDSTKKDNSTIKNGSTYTGNEISGQDPTEGLGDNKGNKTDAEKEAIGDNGNSKGNTSKTNDPTQNTSKTNNSGVNESKSNGDSKSGSDNSKSDSKSDSNNSNNSNSSSDSSTTDNDLDYIDVQTLKDTIHQAEMPEMQMLSSMAGADDRKALATAIIAANKAVGGSKLTMTIANTNLKRAMQFIKNDAKKTLNDQVQQMTAISKTPAFQRLDQKVQTAFNEAMMKASTVNSDPEATYADILNATKDSAVVLQDIYSKADKTDLNNAIEQVQNLKDSVAWNSVPRKTKSMLNKALAKAEDVAANAGANQSMVDDASKDLRSAEVEALTDTISSMKDKIKNGETAKKGSAKIVKTSSRGSHGSSNGSSDASNGSGSNGSSGSSNGGSGSSKGSSGNSGSGSSDGSGSSTDSSQSSDNTQPKSQAAKALPQTGRYIMQHAKAFMAVIGTAMAGLAGYAVYDKKKGDKKNENKD